MLFDTIFRKEQREAKLAYKRRGHVIWQGSTFRYEQGRGLRGKSAIKAAKKLSHIKNFYAKTRSNNYGN